MSRDYINNNYIESARVYLKLGEPNEIIIKCCMCNTVGLTDWLLFLSHLKTSHAADQWQEQRAPNLDTEVQAEVELELQNLKEMNSVDKHTNVETDTDESVFEEKSLNVKVEGVVQDVLIFEEPEAEPNQPFYSMLRTPPELLLDFIDQIRQHEYLWREEYRNEDFKAERMESAEEISQTLAERFKVSHSTHVICRSVCTLLKWFQKQHAMHKDNSSFRCRYQNYYDKLLEFLPTQDIQMVNCDECERRFYNEEQLRRHKYRTHSGSYPYVCDVCHVGFPHACKLRLHRIRYHEDKSKRWQCTFCSYCAANKWDLRAHLPTHSGERNYTCEICGVSTKSSSSLAVHRRTHLPHAVNCPYCPKKYRENYLLKCHIKKMHALELEDELE
ncbi:zinc finger protein 62 homolog isoform X2 [Drosophila hydei]|uniref:Zinc finger protein 62 homolog isoform X2 n=1 Tax=Drosophila hydei TaxID=7224 RepID=A0A6J1L7G6_DROHY|nr:zinc finger protein 62 homolog isoform X2 [Drosophila hydei]